jgi:hypothetical protein
MSNFHDRSIIQLENSAWNRTAYEICMSCDNNFDCPPLIPSDIVRMLWAAHRSEDDRVLEIVEFVLQTRANISQGIELAEHHWKGFTG